MRREKKKEEEEEEKEVHRGAQRRDADAPHL